MGGSINGGTLKSSIFKGSSLRKLSSHGGTLSFAAGSRGAPAAVDEDLRAARGLAKNRGLEGTQSTNMGISWEIIEI